MYKLSKLYIFILLLVLLNSSIYCVSIKNRKIVDQQGRQLTIHGTNIVVKVPPYLPRIDHYDHQWSFSQQDMINCTRLGYNGIRLGMMWAGVQPKNGQYNQTYLNTMQKLINMAGSHGIYSLIDFHQDLIAQKFCGDGIPTWLADQLKLYKTFPYPMGKKIKLNQTGLPSWDKCDTQNWGKYYFAYDVGHTFNQLYRVGSHLNKKFTDFWVKIATKFRGNPYVLGYQLINQPFVGNAIRDLALVIPSIAQRGKFQAFYDNLATAIRKVDNDTLIFFEPITFDNKIPVGFSHPPGGHRFANKSVLAYHYYAPPALGLGTIDSRIADAKRLGIPSFLTEYLGTNIDILDRAQKNQQSWLYWQYKNFGKQWGSHRYFMQPNLQKNQSKFKEDGIDGQHSMTYLQKTAGILQDQQFNFKTKHYVAHYLATPNGQSILYYCSFFNYPNGHQIQIFPRVQVSLKEFKPGYYQIIYTGNQPRLIQVSLTAL